MTSSFSCKDSVTLWLPMFQKCKSILRDLVAGVADSFFQYPLVLEKVLAFSDIVVKSYLYTVLSSSFPPPFQGEFKKKIIKQILDTVRESGQF